MRILITGGAGYIGSHTVKRMLKIYKDVTVLDNLCRGHLESVPKSVKYVNLDLLNYEAMENFFKRNSFDAIIHFAAFAYVGESIEKPDLYYQNNVIGSFNLINLAAKSKVKYFVFSSTCSVYGNPESIPITEETPTAPINPYARTKLAIEGMLKDFELSSGMRYVSLRYFNAAGDDESGEIGESHNPEPHLIPLIMFACLGRNDNLKVFGNDYETKDGTCIRDYIHVNDLADAHIKAIEYLAKDKPSEIVNLGTGVGYSVFEIIEKAKEIVKKDIKYKIVDRRPGDPAILVADNSKAKKLFDWYPKYDLEMILNTAYNWHKNQKY